MSMPKRYGILYSGSKNKICERIIDILPPADNFYDLFAGGCAVTHRALLSGKYNNVIANDINDMPLLFKDAIQGKYKDEDRWITREMFFDNLDNTYISSCWSFGGNMTSYINTANAYNVKFDYEKFYSWCENQSSPVFISEYNMPEDRFKCIKTIQVGRKCSSTKFDICDEKVFVPNHQYQDFLTYKNKNNLLCR